MSKTGSVKGSSVASMMASTEMLMPPPEIPRLERGRRLYIVTGPDWEVAVDDFYVEEPSAPVWRVDRTYRDDDILLTIIGTTPRVFLCLEYAVGNATDRGTIWVDDDYTIPFENGISVNAVQDRVGFNLKGGQYFSGVRGNAILDALRDEYANPSPWFAPRRPSVVY